MAFNPNGAADCSLDVFGGWVSETDPTSLPAGVSPDCPECDFVPGTVFTRPAFQRIFSPPLAPNTTITYGKSFVDADGTIYNLYLASDGTLYKEDLTNNPGAAFSIFSTTPGRYARSVTLDGREYIAISDGSHGQDVPLQFDGVNLDRVTMDGPGTPPTVTSVIIPSSELSSFPFTAGAFVEIPVQGGGSICIGAGNVQNGGSIPFPAGFSAANSIAWASPQNGWDRNTEVEGVYFASVNAGVVTASFQARDGSNGFPSAANWVAAAWTPDASVTLSYSATGTITYLSFITQQGDKLCIAEGFLNTATPQMTAVPAGFDASHFAYIAGPATTNHSGNGMQYVAECGLDGTLTKIITYSDNQGHLWSGGINLFGIFWQAGGGVTQQSVTGGIAVIVPLSTTESVAFIQAAVNSGASYGLPTGFSAATFLAAASAMSGVVTTAGSNVSHGWPFCEVTGQQFTGTYQDGQGNTWAGIGNIFAVSVSGTTAGTSLTRLDNTVTAITLTAHGLQVGYQVQISGVPATPVGNGIVSIVIDNEANPGIATVTTNIAHGLEPGNNVTITNVPGATVSGITTITRQGQVVTVTTSTDHKLTPGALVTLSGVTDGTFNGTFTVAAVIASDQFVYTQADNDATSSTGTVTLAWPIPSDTPTPTYFEVVSSPTLTSFQVQVNYSNGTWNGGSVSFGWNGFFFVTNIETANIFQYQQYGPDASTSSAGTVTPFGQAAPGVHRCRQSFLTRQGNVTKPSPWVQFIANGGQYLQISNLAIGPTNVVARILEFTGALGSLFYYIPAPAEVNGITVSTATQINDNTTTSALLDFSDNTLYAGISTSIPGNNTPAQIVLEGALGFASFDTYLVTWGQRNTVTNLLNMGFDGGTQPSAPQLPTGWTTGGPSISVISSIRGTGLGQMLEIQAGGHQEGISQGAYQDCFGAPILVTDTQYKLRIWAKGVGSVFGVFSSNLTGFSATAFISYDSLGGQFYEADFSDKTPSPIPPDMLLTLNFSPSGTTFVDDSSLIYSDTPYTDSILNISYSNNFEAFDGVTGKTGPSTDPRQVMDFATISDIPYVLTLDPAGRLHEISSTSTALPAGWQVNERAANCGVLSAFALTKSQADDGSSSGGEEWFAWASESGARIFGGNQPWKISQEIQPNWNDASGTPSQINMAAQLTVWSMNDPVERKVYFGLPLALSTAPSAIYMMNYRELDTAEQIAFSPPYRVGFSGKLIATDNTRKWSPWYRPMSGAARMYRQAGKLTAIFFGGTGSTPGASGFGNVYQLNPAMLLDDDFGQIVSYYTTCCLPTKDQEQGLQLGAWRKILASLNALIAGNGNIIITTYQESLSNPWPITCTRPLSSNPIYNLEYGGGNCEAYRMFFKIQPVPLAGQNYCTFNLSRFVASFRASRVKMRGAAN